MRCFVQQSQSATFVVDVQRFLGLLQRPEHGARLPQGSSEDGRADRQRWVDSLGRHWTMAGQRNTQDHR